MNHRHSHRQHSTLMTAQKITINMEKKLPLYADDDAGKAGGKK